MARDDTVRIAFADQARWCEKLGSPFTSRLMAGLGERLDRSTRTGEIVLDWVGPVDARGDAVPLRLAGALHALVRRGRLPELASVFPPNPVPSVDVLADAAMQAIADQDETVCEWLKQPPQTNEVGRCAALYPGLMVVSQETGLPLSLFEVGSSAGLNLFPDRYAYRFGGVVLGDPDGSVMLSPNWSGPDPTGSEPRILGRRGCDRNPLNVSDPDDRERLVAYIWPDQIERIKRVSAAIDVARTEAPRIDRADAGDWVDDVVGSQVVDGTTRVLMHSIAFQYFPEDTKRRIASRMNTLGRTATREAPLAWLSLEQRGEDGPHLTLQLWPGGSERTLGTADAHVRNVRWMGTFERKED